MSRVSVSEFVGRMGRFTPGPVPSSFPSRSRRQDLPLCQKQHSRLLMVVAGIQSTCQFLYSLLNLFFAPQIDMFGIYEINIWLLSCWCWIQTVCSYYDFPRLIHINVSSVVATVNAYVGDVLMYTLLIQYNSFPD